MALVQSLIDPSKYNIKCPYSMNPIGICVHNTANDASAKNEIAYMKSNNYEVSFHIAIDDVEAIQAIPFNRNAWASGDGATGKGNRSYIHIEICYSKSGGTRFINAEKRAAKEIALLLKKYGWTINNVKRHKDFSNKYCPHRTMDMGWDRFLNMVQAELNALNNQVQSNNDVLYKVQVGAFSNKSNAERLANELKSKGYQAIITAVKKCWTIVYSSSFIIFNFSISNFTINNNNLTICYIKNS